MGTSSEDCSTVAKLIGIKVFVNEFVAYKYLGETIQFRNGITANSTYEFYRNGKNSTIWWFYLNQVILWKTISAL